MYGGGVGLDFAVREDQSDDTAPGIVVMRLQRGGDYHDHMLTPWSWQQLHSHVGVRKKWFQVVMPEQRVKELQARLPVFEGFMVRTMRTSDTPDLHLVRGLVSSRYGDIPDTDILAALIKSMGDDGHAVRYHTGKTDRALYVYAVTGEILGVPGTKLQALPGVVIRNSEVGFTSLWAIPMLYFPSSRTSVVFERDKVFRRIHRGSAGDLKADFDQAISTISRMWGPLTEKLRRLVTITFHTQEDAINKMTDAITASGGSKLFALRCAQKYAAAGNNAHSGLTIFGAVEDYVSSMGTVDKNAVYSRAAVAGGVLMWLLR